MASMIALLLALAAIRADEAKLSGLEGTWVWVSITHDGEVTKLNGGVWTAFNGNTIRAVTFGADNSLMFRTNPTARPATIDFLDPSSKKPRGKGIYKIEKDILTLCIRAADDGDRPTDFKVTKDTRITVMKRTTFVLAP